MNPPDENTFYTPEPVDDLPRSDYANVAGPDPHVARTRELMKRYPHLKQLFGTEPRSAFFGVGLVLVQLASAIALRNSPWITVVVLSYFVGAAVNHAIWVLVHEVAHNLIFKKTKHNRWFGMFLNFPQVVPAAMAFCKYHLLHHGHQGVLELDADMPGPQEAAMIGNSKFRKFLFLLFFTFLQGAVHPTRLKEVPFWDRWIGLNVLTQVAFSSLFFWMFGAKALVFLALSTFFSLGLHPLGGRWISEHYLVKEHQETNSYYGGLNKISFNVGYHNEHHDLPQVPWSRLPEVTEQAPEFYQGLFSYDSWTWALWRFITDDDVTTFDRVRRPKRERRHSKTRPEEDGGAT
jgi:sphingolipid 4-desaturase/C4-monooxygenase